ALFFPADPSNSDSFDAASIDLRTAIDGAVSGGPSLLRGGNYFLAILFNTTSSTPVRFEEVSVDYVLEFTVTAIPLPATAWLMLAGLGGLVALRRPAVRSPATRQEGLP
ncbi:MAG: VPLPA-CTERM sorting domain-containing protein, partial [Pseudomonadota bacterium]